MHYCIMVKIGEAKKRKLNENKGEIQKFRENRGKLKNVAGIGEFINFVEIKGNMQYASLA